MEESITPMLALEQRIETLEREALLVRDRNLRVEADKAWETSSARRAAVLLITYVMTALVFYLIGAPRFLVSALIPAIGYWLSTLTLPFLKEKWICRRMSAPKQ